MKTLIDDTEVIDSTYYYLLDFNERDNWKTIYKICEKHRLCDLEISEYVKLFEEATKKDLEILKTLKTNTGLISGKLVS